MIKSLPGFDSKIPWKQTNNTATNPLAYGTYRYETWRKNDEIALNNIARASSSTSSSSSRISSSFSGGNSSSGGSSSTSGGSSSSSNKGKFLSNYDSNVVINTGTGNDTISNMGDNVTIRGGVSNDYIINDGDYSYIRAGSGNDSISNYATTVSIDGGDGNDKISNTKSSNVSINAGSGNDSIYNLGWEDHDAENVTINAGASNDYISNHGANVSISGGDGNDDIFNDGSQVSINGGKGNDKIYLNTSHSSNVIQYAGGDGNDTIYGWKTYDTLEITCENFSTQVSGSDIIYNVGNGSITLVDMAGGTINYSHIQGSNGGESISNSDNNKTILGNDYADTIVNNGSNVTINAGDGDDYIRNNGSFVMINGGNDDDYVRNVGYYDDNDSWYGADNTSIIGGAGNDTITNYGSSVSIDGGAGEDLIDNQVASNVKTGEKVTINGGDGKDTISNWGASVTINGGDGNDKINNTYLASNVSIIGGSGNDSIDNVGTNTTIDGGTGDDYVWNFGSNATIAGGAGDDTIYLGNASSKVIIEYTTGDGNDSISGFNETSTLQIGDGTGTYSTVQSGSDIIVGVGDGKITLVGAASLSSVNIEGTFIGKDEFNLTKDTLITGTKFADNIMNFGNNVSINAGAGADSITTGFIVKIDVNESLVSVIGDGDDAFINGGDDDDVIDNYGAKATILGGAGDDVIYNNGMIITDGEDTALLEVEDEFSIDGGAGNDVILNYNSGATINGSSGSDIVFNYGNNTSINGGENNDGIATWEADNVTISGGKGDDVIFNMGTDDKGGNNLLFKYSSGDGNDIIEGFNETSTLSISGSTYFSTKSGDDIIVTVGDGKISLIGAVDLSSVNIDGTEENYWNLTGTTAKYGTSGKTLATVQGVKSLNGISLSGSTVTVANSALNNSTVKISDGYTLKLANDVPISSTMAVGWILSGTTATYKQTTSAGYTLANDKKSATYSGEISNNLITVSGIKSKDGLSVNGKVVTVPSSALNNSNITVSDGYTLNLVNAPSPTISNSWTSSGTTATYKQTTTAGYTLANDKKSATYSGDNTKTLITVSGIKSKDGLSVNGKVVTVPSSALNNSNITVSDGYTLNLVNAPSPTISNSWTLSGTTATYKQTTSAGYKLANDKKSATYSGEISKNLITLNGVKAANGLSLNGKVVTVSNAALNKGKVTVSDGYTLKLGKDVTKPKTSKDWSLYKTKATYKQTTSEGYTLADNAINYSKKAVETLATVKGIKSLDGLSLKKKVVTVSAASLGTNKVTVSDGYTLKLGNDVVKPTTSKAWSLNKTKATYKQTTSEGYTLADNAINYSKKAVETLATVKGVKSTDGISLKKNVITVSEASLNKKKITVSEGYTLKLNKDVTKSTNRKAAWSLSGTTATYKSAYKTAGYALASDKKSITYSKATAASALATVKGAKSVKGLSVSGKKITLKNSALSSKVTIGGGYEFDFAKDYKQSTITGSKNADTITAHGTKVTINGGAGDDYLKSTGSKAKILGGAGNDSLWGGAGNDSLYGGSGDDTFIYKPGEGTDKIFDYQSGDMLKILKPNGKDGGSFTKSAFSGGNLTLTISGGGKVVFEGVSSGDSFNINGKNYTLSGKTLAK